MGTLLAWIALLAAILSALYAWKVGRALEGALGRLDRYNRSLFQANDEIRALQEALAAQSAQLRVALRRRDDQPLIEPTMTVAEIVAAYPQAQSLLAQFHVGGCSSCAVSADDTLLQVCREQQIDLAMMLGALNDLPESDSKQNGLPHTLKRPNIEFVP